MGLRGIAILLGLVLCGFALYYVTVIRGTGSAGSSRGPVRSLERRANDLEPIDRPAASATRALPDAAEILEEPPASGPAAARTIDVTVLVLSRRSQAPQADLAVELAPLPPLEGVAPARAVTNAFGSATLRVEKRAGPRGERCSVTVGPPEKAQVVGPLPLKEQLVVLVEDCTRLHGRVRVLGVPREVRGYVQLDEPARGAMGSPVMIGLTPVAEGGEFEIHACPTREIPWVDVQVLFGSIAAVRRVRWEDLASEAGASIDVAFTDMVVRVVDETDAPLAGAAVRAAFVGGGGVFPAVGTTDARGEYRATLEPGEVEVIAGLQGFASATDRLQLAAGAAAAPVILRLRRLDERDRLRGRVIREDGSPIENALVSASPALASPDAAVAGIVQQRTSSDGRFELAIAGGRELSVTAYRRDLGLSDTLRFFADGREVELVIRAQGSLEVRVAPLAAPGFQRGRVEYVLVDRRFEHAHHGHDFGVPFTVEELPAGDYNVFVFVEGSSGYAEGSVRVAPETTTTVTLAPREARFARGTVHGAVPGMTLSLDHPTWPREVEKLWAEVLDDRGRFDLLLGEEASCPALIAAPGGAARRVDLRAGNANEISIRR